MKRPKSYGQDLDEAVGEKAVFKDWVRRDQDPDRPSSHRRFYPKAESGRKGSSSSSYDRSLDDEPEPVRPPKKRLDHELDGFDRRKSFDRYRDGGDRPIQVSSSPRGVYSSDRMHRSESFSRREFPKGFRSERDRSRRDGSSGSSWRRSSSWKEVADEEMRSPASDSMGRGNHAQSEDRGSGRSKDSSRGELSRSVETTKAVEEVHRESCSSSEMEEGELEPDPDPEPAHDPEPNPKPVIGLESEIHEDEENECKIVTEASLENEVKLAIEERLGFDEEGACDGKEEGILSETEVDQSNGYDVVTDHHNDPVKALNEEIAGRGGDGDDNEEVEANLAGKKQEILEEERMCLPTHGLEPKGQGEGQVVEEGRGISVSTYPPVEKNLEEEQGEWRGVEVEVEVNNRKETGIDLEFEQKEGEGFDLEIEPEGTIGQFDSSKEVVLENDRDEITVKFMIDKPKENYKDKGKGLAVSLSNQTISMEEEDTMEGPSGRGFELVFHSDVARSEKANCGGVVIGKQKDEKLKLEPLELSLCLPGILLDHTTKHPNPRPNSPSHARSIQSLPTSFHTNSDGFMPSISFSGSQPFSHNPSCSLTQNSLENYEHSVGSHPIFQGVDQVPNGTVWQGQSSNEPKWKGGAGPLFQKILTNGNGSHHSSHRVNGQHHLKPNGPSRQFNFPRQLSPTHSHGSRDTRSEHSRDKRLLTRERSSSSLFRSEQREGEQLVLNGVSVVERIVTKIVAEPVQVIGRMLQEMTEQSLAYLKETVCEMIVSVDKHGQIHALQEALQRRPDLTLETMPKCHRTLLEILVALKTGLPDFLQRANSVTSSDLVEIFLNQKCRNLDCRSVLPVDDCECKVCIQKNGFCSACMCLVCSKFDMAWNTCSWVGCDVCLHWCHTDCGLRDSHIRNGRSISGTQGLTELQFHCIACDHPSELFGFVKEVFKTCAKGWNAETLAKELQYVRRIFSASNDMRGKKLCDMADRMMVKLEDKSNLSEVISYVMAFLADCESNFSNSPSSFPSKETAKIAEESNGMAYSSKEAPRLPPVAAEKVFRVENIGAVSSFNRDRLSRQTREAELQVNLQKKPVVDELEGVVKFKQAEAKMYQGRADDARREAEGLKRIAIAKNEKIDEEYARRTAKLRLQEVEERRRKKLEELQVLERAHREYFNMKMRMEADIKDLLSKMEATKRNFIM